MRNHLQALLHPTPRDVAAFHVHDAHCADQPCYDATIEQHQGSPTDDDYARADMLLAALDQVGGASQLVRAVDYALAMWETDAETPPEQRQARNQLRAARAQVTSITGSQPQKEN